MPDPEPGQEGQRRMNPHLERFLRGFEGAIESADRQEKAAEALINTVVDEKGGLIPAIDDLIDEVRGLREDIRAICAASGIRAAFKRMREL